MRYRGGIFAKLTSGKDPETKYAKYRTNVLEQAEGREFPDQGKASEALLENGQAFDEPAARMGEGIDEIMASDADPKRGNRNERVARVNGIGPGLPQEIMKATWTTDG